MNEEVISSSIEIGVMFPGNGDVSDKAGIRTGNRGAAKAARGAGLFSYVKVLCRDRAGAEAAMAGATPRAPLLVARADRGNDRA
jgi:hypothetical protein